MRPTAAQLIERLALQPLPVEGGLFVQTWRGETAAGTGVDGKARPAGTATCAMLTSDPDSFSAMHRLPTDEIWHFYLGDPIEILLLKPDRGVERIVLGPDVLSGQQVQAIIPAGTWMGARLRPGGEYGLFGNTMAPGFTESDYVGGDERLAELYPSAADHIRALLRPGVPTEMPLLD